MTLSEILKDSNYKLTQFSLAEQLKLEQRIKLRIDSKGNAIPYAVCLVRSKEIKLTPEELIRQLYLQVLIDDYGYPTTRMELEYAVSFGREKKRADVVVFDKDQTTSPYIIIEIKKPKLKDGKEQLKSYCNGTGAPIGVWSNGDSISYYHRKDPNYFEDLPAIPKATEKLSDILSERWTIDDLINKDKLVNERKSLKDLILEMEDEVLANAGVDVFEESFKLVFTKLYDEMETGANIGRTNIYQSGKKALASNHVNILRVTGEDPYYVSFVMNSLIGRMQIDKLSAGSAQAELYPKDIAQFIIPFIDKAIQKNIREKIISSLTLKKQSATLLEVAKRAVEIAIEQDEAAGMAYLEALT